MSKIFQLHAICEVTLLSTQGDILLSLQKTSPSAPSDTKPPGWNELITSLGRPRTADFLFAKGRYFLQQTAIGYMIVGMRDESSLNKVKIACTTVRQKLTNPAIRKQTLLKLLVEADDAARPQVIKELMVLADRDVARVLLGLLRRQSGFTPLHRDRLLLFICQALGHCGTREAVEPLKALLTTAGVGNALASGVENAARIAIRQLEQVTTAVVPPGPPAAPQASRQPDGPAMPPADEKKSLEPDFPEARPIAALLENNQKAEAMTLILRNISLFARNRDFLKAEKLRSWLMELDPMAVNHIIRAGEIIEEEQKGAIDPAHLKGWHKLVDAISLEAFSAIYHVCSVRSYAAGETIVRQGDLLPALLFINSGKVQVQMACHDKTESIKIVNQGEIIGTETFFEASVWTIGVRSLDAEVFVLPFSSFLEIRDNHPTLEARLKTYCGRPLLPRTLFNRAQKNRRRHERRTASSQVSIALLDDQENDLGKRTKGDLQDISLGGLALSFHACQRHAAGALLGKRVRISENCQDSGPALARTGIVKAIGTHDHISNSYLMHLQFTQQLTAAELQHVGAAERMLS